MNQVPTINTKTLLGLYDGFLLDAYGVLVNAKGPLPHAKEFIEHLNKTNKDFFIVTNNASSSTQKIAKGFLRNGFSIPEEKILSSGSLIKPWIKENFKSPPKSLFMGSHGAEKLLDDTNAQITNLMDFKEAHNEAFDLVVLCTQEDKNFRSSFEKLMSYLFRAKENKAFPKIIIPNPDLIYPKDETNFGIVSGMVALMLEKSLKLRFPSFSPNIIELGKPSSYIFKKAKERFPGKKLLMIGDQIETDVKGATISGLDSALMLGGVVSEKNLRSDAQYKPNYLLQSLEL